MPIRGTNGGGRLPLALVAGTGEWDPVAERTRLSIQACCSAWRAIGTGASVGARTSQGGARGSVVVHRGGTVCQRGQGEVSEVWVGLVEGLRESDAVGG